MNEVVRYFAYGSNLLHERLLSRCKTAKKYCVARLEGYHFSFSKLSIDKSGKATIEKSDAETENASVYGFIYELAESELSKLDNFEGDEYEPIKVNVECYTKKDKSVNVVTYIAKSNNPQGDLIPYDWYHRLIIRGAEQHQLPEKYVNDLKNMRSEPDPKLLRDTRLEALRLLDGLLHQDTRIAGSKTVGDWIKLSAQLVVGGNSNKWAEAYDNFFMERISTRYLDPIKAIEKEYPGEKAKGQGFSILIIQCSLIEFLGSTYEGKIYTKFVESKEWDPDLHYQSSSKIMLNFFRECCPFKGEFTRNEIDDFYNDIRCGLFHEARVKGDWRIQLSTNHEEDGEIIKDKEGNLRPINYENKVLFRDLFTKYLERYFDWYKEELLKNTELQLAFKRKFDQLCRP